MPCSDDTSASSKEQGQSAGGGDDKGQDQETGIMKIMMDDEGLVIDKGKNLP